MEKILSIENLAKHFGNNKVLKDINLDVYKGDVVAIIGPSGSGKKTKNALIERFFYPTY